MNDEIKEILEILKKCYDLKDENFDNYISLYQLGLLLDYITNLQHQISLMEEDIRESKEINGELQQENEYLKKQNDEKTKIGIADHKYASQMEDKVIELQQENERLKEENNNKAMNDYAHAIDESWYRELYDDYKSRCEKSIAILNNIYMLDNVTITNNACDEIDKAINILQGENNGN